MARLANRYLLHSNAVHGGGTPKEKCPRAEVVDGWTNTHLAYLTQRGGTSEGKREFPDWRLVAWDQAEQFPLGCSDQQLRDLSFAHPLSDRAEVLARSDGGGTTSHDLAGRAWVLRVDTVKMFESAGNDAAIIDHDAKRGPVAETTAHRPNLFGEVTGWDVRVHSTEDAGLGWAGPLGGPSGCDPVDLAGGVVVDATEAELFEPPRGPGAHVSKGIPAVDDDWSGWVEDSDGAAIELFEGHVDRSRKMFLGVLFRGEDLHELGCAVEEPAQLVTVDRDGHEHFLVFFSTGRSSG
jgi:hypothetical protein